MFHWGRPGNGVESPLIRQLSLCSAFVFGAARSHPFHSSDLVTNCQICRNESSTRTTLLICFFQFSIVLLFGIQMKHHRKPRNITIQTTSTSELHSSASSVSRPGSQPSVACMQGEIIFGLALWLLSSIHIDFNLHFQVCLHCWHFEAEFEFSNLLFMYSAHSHRFPSPASYQESIHTPSNYLTCWYWSFHFELNSFRIPQLNRNSKNKETGTPFNTRCWGNIINCGRTCPGWRSLPLRER